MGAHAGDILLLFLKDALRWVIWANLLAWPIAFFVARRWLEGFAYRIDVEVWMFALAGLLSLLIAVFTVGWHSVRTALSDPVQSLRYE
jgi:putative ABC transport system permease protein